MISLQALIRKNEQAFGTRFGSRPALTAFAPGRINIVGEHTDYNNGLAMPAAIDRWILVSSYPRRDLICHIHSTDFNSSMHFKLGEEFVPSETWQQYVFGAISIVHDKFQLPNGLNAVIRGNIPIGSGLASSGALEVALMNAIRFLFQLGFNDLELIKLCQRVEHEYLHLQSGLLDQFASQFSRSGQLMVLDFDSLTADYFDANTPDSSWVIVDSGIKRELAHSKYMERVRECREGLVRLQNSGLSITRFRDITQDHLKHLDGESHRRINHYVSENARVLAAKESILQGDPAQLGQLITASHKSLQTDYDVSCDELDFLVETALNQSGCMGARMMGGGFGGCTLNLVTHDSIEAFTSLVHQHYKDRYSRDASMYHFNLVDGASAVRSEDHNTKDH